MESVKNKQKRATECNTEKERDKERVRGRERETQREKARNREKVRTKEKDRWITLTTDAAATPKAVLMAAEIS